MICICSKEILSFNSYKLENDLFNIYDKGLNIFNKSLCGMEIAFEEIHNSIENALVSDVKFGLADTVDEIVNFSENVNFFENIYRFS